MYVGTRSSQYFWFEHKSYLGRYLTVHCFASWKRISNLRVILPLEHPSYKLRWFSQLPNFYGLRTDEMLGIFLPCALSFLDHKANLSPYLFQCGFRKYFITRPHLCVSLLIPSNKAIHISYLGLHRTNTTRKRWKSDPTKLLTPNKFEEWLISATGKFLKCLKETIHPVPRRTPLSFPPITSCHPSVTSRGYYVF